MQTSQANDPSDKIFDSVLYIGPALEGKGGMSAVLKAYQNQLPAFSFLPSNNTKGTLAGLFSLAGTLLQMPLKRAQGKRIVHIHFASWKSYTRKRMIANWAKLLGYKVVMHCHGAEFAEFSKHVGEENIGNALNQYDHVIVLSDYWEDYFKNTLHCKNVTIVPNIVVPLKPSSMPKCDGTHPFTFLFLAAINDRKGIWDLLQACTKLHDADGHGWRMIVAGAGDDKRLVQTIDQLGLEDKVEFVGWISGEKKSEIFAETNALILPSYNEGLPLTIIESLSLARGVITTPVGGIAEVIHDEVTGLMVTPGDVDGIAKAMQRYIDNPALASAHGEAGKKAASGFTPQAVIENLRKIYSSI